MMTDPDEDMAVMVCCSCGLGLPFSRLSSRSQNGAAVSHEFAQTGALKTELEADDYSCLALMSWRPARDLYCGIGVLK